VGANDPLCIYVGNYDRWNYARSRWTEIPLPQEDRGNYIQVRLAAGPLPTFGANGFMVRRKALTTPDDFVFDIDIPGKLRQRGFTTLAKVKVGIIHLYARRTRDFIRKQRRRVHDYYYYQAMGKRTYAWNQNTRGVLGFILSTMTIFPLIYFSWLGNRKRKDAAWWLHSIACWITLWVYGTTTLLKCLGWKPREYNRNQWRQV
jgi:hypothetical protein